MCVLMEVVDAVDLIGCVDCEGHAVETRATHHTLEAGGVVRLARRTQDLKTHIVRKS